MTNNEKLSDAMYELGAVLPGEALERLKGMLADPGADHTPGQLARIGAAFTDVGNRLSATVRDGMYDRLAGGLGENSRLAQDGVLFQWRAPREETAVDTKAVRSMFPKSEYSELYKTRQVRGTVAITMLDVDR